MTSAPASAPTVAQRTAANSLFSFASFFISAAVVAITTPIVIHHLGVEQYGILSLSLTIVSFLGLLDAGISTTLVRFVADRKAVGDSVGINRLVSASLAIYLAIGAIALVCTAVVAIFFTGDIFNLTHKALAPARFAFAVAGVAFFFTFVGKIFSAVILALQRNDLSAAIRIAITASTGAGTIALVYLGYGVRALVVLTATVAVLGLCAYWLVAERLLPELSVRVRSDSALVAWTLRFSGWIFLANTTAFLLFQLDRLFLGALKSVSLVTYYAVPGSVASYLMVAVTNLAAITIAVATGFFARGEREQVIRLYLRATRFVMLFLLSIAVPALVLAKPILKFWIGADFADRSVGVFRLLLLTYATIGLTVVSYNVILAAGRPRVLGLVNLGTFAVNVVLILILIPRYGVIGAGWAYLLSVLPLLLLVLYAERSVLATGHRHWFRDLTRFALPTAAAAATAILLEPVASNLAEVLLVAAAAGGVLVLLYLQWFAERNDRELVLQLAAVPRLRQFVRRP